MVPEGRGVFGALTIEENLAMGAYIRNDKAEIRRHRARLRAVSAAQGTAPADRGHAFGRRAADARDGACADVAAEAAAARRAIDGTRAAHGAESLRNRDDGLGRRRHDPADRAEREARPRGEPSRLRNGIRARSRSRARRRRCCTIPPSARPTSERGHSWRAGTRTGAAWPHPAAREQPSALRSLPSDGAHGILGRRAGG